MNYGDLKTHFEALLNRSDITQTLTKTFIDQGLARIERQLRTPMNEKKVEYVISNKTTYVTLPQDFLQTIALYMDKYELQRTSMSQYRELQKAGAEGIPQHFMREQQRIYLYPVPTSGTLSLYYYCTFPALVNNQDENDLTAIAPELVIYAALTFAADFYLDERSAVFEQKFLQFMAEVQEQAFQQELQGGSNSIQPAYSFGDL